MEIWGPFRDGSDRCRHSVGERGSLDEILRMLSIVKKLNHPVIAITASRGTGLGSVADAVIAMGKISEACPLGLAPSASTTAMLALWGCAGENLTVMRRSGILQRNQFSALYSPCQVNWGEKLIRVGEAMSLQAAGRKSSCRQQLTLTVGQVCLHEVSKIKRRSGAVILIDKSHKLSGVFTDGDLRRVMTDNDGSALNRPIADVMTKNPKRIREDHLASEAMAIMQQHRIDELPVVDANDHPVGLIDVQDLVMLRMLDVEPEGDR